MAPQDRRVSLVERIRLQASINMVDTPALLSPCIIRVENADQEQGIFLVSATRMAVYSRMGSNIVDGKIPVRRPRTSGLVPTTASSPFLDKPVICRGYSHSRERDQVPLPKGRRGIRPTKARHSSEPIESRLPGCPIISPQPVALPHPPLSTRPLR